MISRLCIYYRQKNPQTWIDLNQVKKPRIPMQGKVQILVKGKREIRHWMISLPFTLIHDSSDPCSWSYTGIHCFEAAYSGQYVIIHPFHKCLWIKCVVLFFQGLHFSTLVKKFPLSLKFSWALAITQYQYLQEKSFNFIINFLYLLSYTSVLLTIFLKCRLFWIFMNIFYTLLVVCYPTCI